jgi:hypothetical protein
VNDDTVWRRRVAGNLVSKFQKLLGVSGASCMKQRTTHLEKKKYFIWNALFNSFVNIIIRKSNQPTIPMEQGPFDLS